MDNYYIEKSKIHGNGIFAKITFAKKDTIGIAFLKYKNTGITDIDYMRFELGKYINHSDKPNVELVEMKNCDVCFYFVCALKNIDIHEELTLDYKKITWNGEKVF